MAKKEKIKNKENAKDIWEKQPKTVKVIYLLELKIPTAQCLNVSWEDMPANYRKALEKYING